MLNREIFLPPPVFLLRNCHRRLWRRLWRHMHNIVDEKEISWNKKNPFLWRVLPKLRDSSLPCPTPRTLRSTYTTKKRGKEIVVLWCACSMVTRSTFYCYFEWHARLKWVSNIHTYVRTLVSLNTKHTRSTGLKRTKTPSFREIIFRLSCTRLKSICFAETLCRS